MYELFEFFYIIFNISEYKPYKSVKFDTIIKVYLIPSRKDYTEQLLKDKIWYSDEDYKLFIDDNID